MSLTTTETSFLKERLDEQKSLQEKVDAAQEKIDVINKQINESQVMIEAAYDRQRILGAQKQTVIKETDLMAVKKQLSNVAKDTTKLLRKKRGA